VLQTLHGNGFAGAGHPRDDDQFRQAFGIVHPLPLPVYRFRHRPAAPIMPASLPSRAATMSTPSWARSGANLRKASRTGSSSKSPALDTPPPTTKRFGLTTRDTMAIDFAK